MCFAPILLREKCVCTNSCHAESFSRSAWFLMPEKLSDSSLCVHAGEDVRKKNVSLTTPIVQTSVFALASLDEMRKIAEGTSTAYLYTRYANPTTRVAESKLAALEGADDCVVTSSGQAATLCSLLAVCRSGDEVLSMLD